MVNMTVANPNLFFEPVDPVERVVNPLERLVELEENRAMTNNIELCIFALVMGVSLYVLFQF